MVKQHACLRVEVGGELRCRLKVLSIYTIPRFMIDSKDKQTYVFGSLNKFLREIVKYVCRKYSLS